MALETVSAPNPIATYADEATDEPAADASRLTGERGTQITNPVQWVSPRDADILRSHSLADSITFQWVVKPKEIHFSCHLQATRIGSATGEQSYWHSLVIRFFICTML